MRELFSLSKTLLKADLKSMGVLKSQTETPTSISTLLRLPLYFKTVHSYGHTLGNAVQPGHVVLQVTRVEHVPRKAYISSAFTLDSSKFTYRSPSVFLFLGNSVRPTMAHHSKSLLSLLIFQASSYIYRAELLP
jgi:hypothetical protein